MSCNVLCAAVKKRKTSIIALKNISNRKIETNCFNFFRSTTFRIYFGQFFKKKLTRSFYAVQNMPEFS